MDNERQPLLAFQWAVYPDAHRDRRNLLIHLLTVPIFMAGTILALATPWQGPWGLLLGLVAMMGAIAAQGRGHRNEQQPPAPFRGPADVVLRIFAEQWITFPRFVLSGGLRRNYARDVR